MSSRAGRKDLINTDIMYSHSNYITLLLKRTEAFSVWMMKMSCISLLLLAVIVNMSVFSRNVSLFNLSGFPIHELAIIGTIWLTFLSSPHATFKDKHIRIEAFYELFPKFFRSVLDLAIRFIGIFTTGTLIISSLLLNLEFINNTTSSGKLPILLVYVPIGLASGLEFVKYVIGTEGTDSD